MEPELNLLNRKPCNPWNKTKRKTVPNDQPMEIAIKFGSADYITLNVTAGNTIHDLKGMIQSKLGTLAYSIRNQVLIWLNPPHRYINVYAGYRNTPVASTVEKCLNLQNGIHNIIPDNCRLGQRNIANRSPVIVLGLIDIAQMETEQWKDIFTRDAFWFTRNWTDGNIETLRNVMGQLLRPNDIHEAIDEMVNNFDLNAHPFEPTLLDAFDDWAYSSLLLNCTNPPFTEILSRKCRMMRNFVRSYNCVTHLFVTDGVMIRTTLPGGVNYRVELNLQCVKINDVVPFTVPIQASFMERFLELITRGLFVLSVCYLNFDENLPTGVEVHEENLRNLLVLGRFNISNPVPISKFGFAQSPLENYPRVIAPTSQLYELLVDLLPRKENNKLDLEYNGLAILTITGMSLRVATTIAQNLNILEVQGCTFWNVTLDMLTHRPIQLGDFVRLLIKTSIHQNRPAFLSSTVVIPVDEKYPITFTMNEEG